MKENKGGEIDGNIKKCSNNTGNIIWTLQIRNTIFYYYFDSL